MSKAARPYPCIGVIVFLAARNLVQISGFFIVRMSPR